MNSKDILQADMLDIIFENRNKQYGAYTLRKNYNSRLGLSLGLGLGAIFLIMFLINNPESQSVLAPKTQEVTVTDLKILEPVLPIPEQPKPKSIQSSVPAAQQKFVDRIAIMENPVKPDVMRVGDNILIGSENIKGPTIEHSFPKLNVPDGNAIVPAVTKTEALIQREPEFPGGMKAWTEFLNKHLVVPAELEAGERKTVMIRFIVDVDGTVSGFEVLQSGGNVYDREVIRVLKRMPKWKPAIQNNLPVTRAFTQPVIFMGIEN